MELLIDLVLGAGEKMGSRDVLEMEGPSSLPPDFHASLSPGLHIISESVIGKSVEERNLMTLTLMYQWLIIVQCPFSHENWKSVPLVGNDCVEWRSFRYFESWLWGREGWKKKLLPLYQWFLTGVNFTTQYTFGNFWRQFWWLHIGVRVLGIRGEECCPIPYNAEDRATPSQYRST